MKLDFLEKLEIIPSESIYMYQTVNTSKEIRRITDDSSFMID